MASRPHEEYTWIEGLAICLGMIGVQLATQVIAQWGPYFYSPSEGVGRIVYVSVGMVGLIFIIGTIWDSITDPLIGMWSDRTKSRPGWLRLIPIHGRRRPFIFWGSIFLVFTSIFFWYPPVPHDSRLNFAYGTALLCLHWSVFTVAVVPLTSLGPEIARAEKARVSLGIWTAVGMIVGLAMAIVLPGKLITMLDPARAGDEFSPIGYRRVAILFALTSFVLLQLPVWLVKERYDSEAHDAGGHTGWAKGLSDALRNRPFVIYCCAHFLFTTGFIAAQNALPYWAELGVGGDEGTVTMMMLPFIVVCLAFFPVTPYLTRRLHTKWMTVLAFLVISTGLPWLYIIPKLAIAVSTKKILGSVLFGYCGIGQSIMYVMMTPLLGEIVDYDETYSGQRREALYNGLMGVAGKVAIAGAILLATQSMRIWGKSVERPTGVFLVGPFAAVFGILGMFAMFFYPVLYVARDRQGDKPANGERADARDLTE
ncbi:MAG TPA: MFS transporter [Candidatus Hydrogenedentes bacterium]|nr:MFS transporter [Candidatus Hydrogenedentota bacterium]HPG68616.1 MFS transporter [Candidatus Hydrogenedentota bacterium]